MKYQQRDGKLKATTIKQGQAQMSTVIEDIIARKVLNSRGEETIEVDVVTKSGFGRASAPSGRSRGKDEVVYYPKAGIDEAVKKVDEEIAPRLIGLNVDSQKEIDMRLHEIDGTKDLSILGGNTVFTVSVASAEAAANSQGLFLAQHLCGDLATELPYPLGNVISGGKHVKGKTPEIQEFLILPYGAESFSEAAIANTKVHKKVGEMLSNKNKLFSGGKSDEGAWIGNIGNLEALNILAVVCEKVGNESGVECGIGIDVAASSLWNSKEEKYVYSRKVKKRDTGEQLEFIQELIKNYHLVYVEDPFHEEDYESTAELTKKAEDCLICGDDLFVTNTHKLRHGIELSAANAVIIKVNQIGTVTDASETAEMAKRAGYMPVMSHRSGDTCDRHIAHLSLAFGCPIIKTGIVEGARIAKINELIRIEEHLRNEAKMAHLEVVGREKIAGI